MNIFRDFISWNFHFQIAKQILMAQLKENFISTQIKFNALKFHCLFPFFGVNVYGVCFFLLVFF